LKLLVYLTKNSLIRLVYFFFIIDLFLTFLFVLGIYFYFDSVQRINYLTQGHLVIITCFTLFFGFFGFLISTAIHIKRTHYRPIIGICLMTIISALSIKIMDSIWTKNQAKTIELILLFIPITAWNIYFCINSYLLVNYRAEEIKER